MTRQAAAIRFAVQSGKRRQLRRFGKALEAYLAARDLAYPEQRVQPVNIKQCRAIAIHYARKAAQ